MEDNVKSIVYAGLALLLKKSFPNDRRRQQIMDKPGGTGFQIACPYCGGSNSNPYKMDVDTDGEFAGQCKCYKCGHHTSIGGLLRDWKIETDEATLRDLRLLYKSSLKSRKYSGSGSAVYLNRESVEQYGVRVDDFMRISKLEKIEHSARAKAYLDGRLQMVYRHFLYNPFKDEILILNRAGDWLIGYQKRSLNPGAKSRFLTVSLSKLNELMRTGKQVPQELDDISGTFGLFETDFSKPVIVTEGPMDSFLIHNAIALSGAKKSLKIRLPVYYLFDSDKAGRDAAAEQLKKGNHVFLWKEMIRDYRLPLAPKWDVNDVVKYCFRNNIKVPDWMDYMTNSYFDLYKI